MFEQMLLPTGGTHQIRNTALAVVLQALAVGFVVFAIPLIFVAQLPKLELSTELIAPPLAPPPPPPAPPAEATRAPATAQIAPRTFVLPRAALTAPIPQQAPMIAEAPPPLPNSGILAGVPGGVPGGVLGGTPGGTLGGSIGAPPVAKAQPAPPQPAVATSRAAPSRIRVGGEVEAAKLTHEVQPAYPPIARMARVAGMVRLSATIASNGAVKDLRVLSGSPLLVDSAVSAVKQWTYRPTYLNGKPVEVLTDIDVKFSLG